MKLRCLFWAVLFSVASSLSAGASPEIYAPSAEGSLDLVFFIEKHEVRKDGSQVLECLGQYKGEKVGFNVVLSEKWVGGSLGLNIPITPYLGKVTFQSRGAVTDSFVRALDSIYGTKLSPKVARESVAFEGVSLSGEPEHLSKGDVRIKLFDSEKKDEAAEIYLNIEMSKKLIKLNEKDASYRLPLVKTFTE
jgi:hypothetical protein